ncbi:MAG: ABC transporter permease [Chloroflexi bacterium]|nr:MAG: ABC transporter permease [Chloroflexota bacterium]
MVETGVIADLRRFLYRSIYEPLRIIVRDKKALAGLIILLFFLLMATIGPEVIPLDMRTNFAERFKPPSREHPLGTDYGGRDVLAMIVHGSRDVLSVAFLAALFTSLIAISVGMTAGLKGGMTDMILNLATNAVLSVPSFPVMLILGSVFKVTNAVTFGLVLSIWSWGPLARAVRSQVLSLKEREFIEAARVMGLSTFHIVFRELLPNVMPYVAINFIDTMRAAIGASVGLMFLGLVPFSATNWGMMLNFAVRQAGAIYLPYAMCYVLSPMAAIMLLELGGVLFAHGLDAVLNPRLRS